MPRRLLLSIAAVGLLGAAAGPMAMRAAASPTPTLITCKLSGKLTYLYLVFGHRPVAVVDTTTTGTCIRLDPANPLATAHVYRASLDLGGNVEVAGPVQPAPGPSCPDPHGPLFQSGTLNLDSVPTTELAIASLVDFPGINGHTPVSVDGLNGSALVGKGVLSDHVFGKCRTTKHAEYSTESVALTFSVTTP